MTGRATFDLLFLPRAGREDDEWDRMPDARLVDRCVSAHDQDAYALLARRHSRRVVHTAAAVLGPPLQYEAEDVAQEAFVRAFDRLHTLRNKERFGAWVCRLAFNLAVDIRRLAWVRRAHVDVDAASLAAGGADPHDLAVASEAHRRLRAEVAALPDLVRSVLHLHYWLGYGVEEIAAMLALPVGTVKSHLHRARHRLGARIEP